MKKQAAAAVTQTELETRRSYLIRELKNQIGPLIEGSIAILNRRCPSPGCHCHKGEPHKAMLVCKKVDGKSYSTYVPVALHEEVRRWNERHKQVKELLKAVSDIGEQIIRGYHKSRGGVIKPAAAMSAKAPKSERAKGVRP